MPGRRGYPDYKAARGLQPIRDWTWSGHTLRCLKVLTANENLAAIGFLDEALPGRRQTASQIAAYNNRRERQWGVSPRDRQAVLVGVQAADRDDQGGVKCLIKQKVILEAEETPVLVSSAGPTRARQLREESRSPPTAR